MIHPRDTVTPQAPKPFAAHSRCVALIPAGSAVLDVGCGDGKLAARLKQRQCFVVGVDRDPEMIAAARPICDEVVCADIETYALERWTQRFDVVLCADVLEHLVEPTRVLARLRDVLKPAGFLVASIPNVAHWSIRLRLATGDFGPDEFGILDADHLHAYTLKTARQLLRSAGFDIRVVEIAYGHRWLTREGWSARMLRAIAGLAKELFAYQFVILATAPVPAQPGGRERV